MSQINIEVPMEAQRKAAVGPVVMVNHYNVPSELAGHYDFVREHWQPDANFMKVQPGFMSAQLLQAIGGQHLWMTYAIWESVQALEAAVMTAKFQEMIARHQVKGVGQLYTKVAVPNVCFGF